MGLNIPRKKHTVTGTNNSLSVIVNIKFRSRSSPVIKAVIILAILVIAPFAVPFTLEFIFVADLVGLEALIALCLIYCKPLLSFMRLKAQVFAEHMVATARLVSELYMFKPGVYLGHATISSAVIVVASSVVLASAVWLPVIVASSDIMLRLGYLSLG